MSPVAELSVAEILESALHHRDRERVRRVSAALGTLAPFASHFRAVPGGALHYIDEGPRTSSAVLAVHGNPTWSFAWRGLVAGLRDRHRVIALDHLGMGLSSRPPRPVRLGEHIENLVSLVDDLGLKEVTLVCHDWGGAIGFGAALARRQIFTRFLVMNTAAFPSAFLPKRIALCRGRALGRVLVRGFNGFAWPATRMTTVRRLPAEVRAAYLAPYSSWSERRQVHEFVRDIPMSEKHPSWPALCQIADKLPDLRGLPMTIFWGERDWCFDRVFRAGWMQRFPDARVVTFEDAGHYVFEDQPERLLEEARLLLATPFHRRPEPLAAAEVDTSNPDGSRP